MPHAVLLRFRWWLAALVVLAAVFAGVVVPRVQVQTDLLDLLPRSRAEGALADRLTQFAAANARKVLFLVGHPAPDVASVAASAFADSLARSGAFSNVRVHWGGEAEAAAELYRQHRFTLLPESARALLSAGRPEELERSALTALYSPLAFARPDVSDDPLGLGAGFLLEQLPSAGAAQLEGDQLVVRDPDRAYILILAETIASPFGVDVQQHAHAAIDAARERADAATRDRARTAERVQILMSGALPHATAATESARREVTVFSTIGTVAVLTLLLGLFRSWRAPVLGLLALGAGACAGITVTHLVFGEVHLIALVFGSSLIGVAIDYAMHFLSDQFRHADWSPVEALDHVAAPILMGMAATLVGFGGLLLLPFPGLRQMAVIALAGLPVACGTVLCLYPALAPRRAARLPGWCAGILARFDAASASLRLSPRMLLALIPLLVLLVLGGARVVFQDDVRALQARFAKPVEEERRIRELLRDTTETAVFVISAADSETVLQSEERLTRELDELVATGQLGNYRAVSRSLPSASRQRADHEALKRYVYSADGVLPRVMRQIGFDRAAIEGEVARFPAEAQPLTPAQWRAHRASAPWRQAWLGERDGVYASIVSLGGARDLAELRALGERLPNVRFIDRVREISTTLEQNRRAVAWLLAGAYAALAIILSLAFGPRAAARLLVPPVAATAIALSALGWLGIPVTLFTVLALLLMLAMGVDYAIFLREARAERRTALLAVSLSALTTMLSFGLLAFSTTPFIRAIGITLAIGIGACWLLAATTAPAPEKAA